MNMKKRIIAMVLAMLIVGAPIFAVYAENNPIYGEAAGIQKAVRIYLKTNIWGRISVFPDILT